MAKIDWQEVARRHKTQSVFMTDASAEGFRRGNFSKVTGVKVKMYHYRHFDSARSLDRKEIQRVIKYLQQQEQKHPGYLLALSKRLIGYYQNVHRKMNRLSKFDARGLSNVQLAVKFRQFYSSTFYIPAGYTYIIVNMFLPDEVVAAVAEREADVTLQNQYLSTLFALDVITDIKAEKISLQKIALMLKAGKKLTNPAVARAIENHWQKFKAFKRYYYFYGDYSLAEIKKLVLAAKQKLDKGERVTLPKDVARETKQIIRKLRLPTNVVKKIYALKGFGMASNVFDENFAHQISQIDFLLKEIAHRLHLTRNELVMAKGEEVVAALRGKVPQKFKQQLQQRWQDYAIVTESKEIKIYTGKALQVYRKRELRQQNIMAATKVITGQPASPGVARGKVVILLDADLMHLVKKGDILVAPSTYPALVPAMERAAAIVTEEGGLLSHAAIVSRELGTPCVVGTKVATKVFKNGDLVEVDAHKGTVKRI